MTNPLKSPEADSVRSKVKPPHDEEDSDEDFFKDITEEEMMLAKALPKVKTLQNQIARHTYAKKTRDLTMQQVTHKPEYTTPKKKPVAVRVKHDVVQKYPFLRLHLRHFKMVRALGEGGYGKVFLAEHIATETLFALKFINLNGIVASNIGKTVKHEIQIGTRPFKNKNVLQLRTFFFEKCFLVLVMEYCPLGDLFHYLTSRKSGRIEDHEAKFIIWSVANALRYMHSKHIMHRDIKPENILLDYHFWQDRPPCTEENKLLLRKTLLELENKPKVSPQNGGRIGNFMRNIKQRFLSFFPGKKKKMTSEQAIVKRQFIERLTYLDYPQRRRIYPRNFVKEVIPKISDFGWSAHSHRGKKTTQCGTIYYMAPEVISSIEYSFNVDVWAIGVLAHEITTGFLPYDGQRDQEIIKKIKFQKIPHPLKISREAWNFIKSILHSPREKRPSLDVVLRHPWLADIRRMMEEKEEEAQAEKKKRAHVRLIKQQEENKKNFIKVNIEQVGRFQNKRVFGVAKGGTPRSQQAAELTPREKKNPFAWENPQPWRI